MVVHRDRNGREVRPGDRVAVFFEMGSTLIPSTGFLHAKQSSVLESYRILLVCDNDNVYGDENVLTDQIESIEPDSGARDTNGFELRLGDEIQWPDGHWLHVEGPYLLRFIRLHGTEAKRARPPTE